MFVSTGKTQLTRVHAGNKSNTIIVLCTAQVGNKLVMFNLIASTRKFILKVRKHAALGVHGL